MRCRSPWSARPSSGRAEAQAYLDQLCQVDAERRAGGCNGARRFWPWSGNARAMTRGLDQAATDSGIEELARFARGLQEDLAAVTAGLTLYCSNGPVEGQITRLKLLSQAPGRWPHGLSHSYDSASGRPLKKPRETGDRDRGHEGLSADYGICGRCGTDVPRQYGEWKPLGLRGRRDRRALISTVQPSFTKTDDEPGGRGRVCHAGHDPSAQNFVSPGRPCPAGVWSRCPPQPPPWRPRFSLQFEEHPLILHIRREGGYLRIALTHDLGITSPT